MDRDTQPWIDKSELSELVSVVASVVDRADRARIVSGHAEDLYDDHGAFKGTGRAFADYICDSGLFTFMHHLIGQSVFDVHADGQQAWGETYFTFEGGVGTLVVKGCGRYSTTSSRWTAAGSSSTDGSSPTVARRGRSEFVLAGQPGSP